MPTVDKRLCAGTLGSSNGTLYTVPTGSLTIVKSLTICNKSAAAEDVTLKLNGVEILAGYVLAAKKTVTIPMIDQIIHAGELIEGLASAAAAINYYISGKEVS